MKLSQLPEHFEIANLFGQYGTHYMYNQSEP